MSGEKIYEFVEKLTFFIAAIITIPFGIIFFLLSLPFGIGGYMVLLYGLMGLLVWFKDPPEENREK